MIIIYIIRFEKFSSQLCSQNFSLVVEYLKGQVFQNKSALAITFRVGQF